MYDVINTFYCNVQEGKRAGRKTRKDKLRRVISAIQPKLNQGRGEENASSVEDDMAHFATFMGASLCYDGLSLFSKRKMQE
jgi:hypothetical protein